jgi:hypothetical protein
MMGCYLDESADPKFKGKPQGIFAVGGLLGRGWAIFELERRWKMLRECREIDIEYFKASECERGSGQFAKLVAAPGTVTANERQVLDAIWDRFLDLIIGRLPEVPVVIGMGVKQEDFYEVIQDQQAKAILGDTPYWFAYQATMIEAAYTMKALEAQSAAGRVSRHKELVAFVCDEHKEYSPIAEAVYHKLKEKNPTAAQYMGSFTSADDVIVQSLQAADAAVFEVRSVQNTLLGLWAKSERWQFRKLKPRLWLMQYADKKYLESVVEDNTPGEPLNLDHFMEQTFDEDVTF